MALREICFFLEKTQHAFNFHPTFPHKKNIWTKGRGMSLSVPLYVVVLLFVNHYMRCFLLRWEERVNKWSHMFFP
jgi:hypothetical protein